MKEIVVIPKEHIEYEQISGAGFDTIRFHLGTDKTLEVPETFADLLTLCKDTKGCFVLRASDREYIEVPTDLIGYSFTFYQDGQIFADEDVCVKEKATPQQMWQIIKSLIGEE